jgi:RNA polymerase sigma-70 factor (ECF subfamily)
MPRKPANTPTDNERDLLLARRCLDQVDAREELYRRFAPQVYRLARRIVGDPAMAEEVLQESFAEVFASIHRYLGKAALSSWLHRIVVRTAVRCCRRDRRHGRHLELIEQIPASSEDAEGMLGRRQALKRLERLLDRVPQGRRAIFILHEVEGYSLAESAALMGISVTAAKKRVWRARRDLERLVVRDPVLMSYLGIKGEKGHV